MRCHLLAQFIAMVFVVFTIPMTLEDGLNSTTYDKTGYITLQRNKAFANQLIQKNTIYEICHDFDLREYHTGLWLNCEFTFGSQIYYTHETGLSLTANQVIWVPSDCVVLNFSKNRILSENGKYNPTDTTTIYVASRKRKSISYYLNGKAAIPDNCVLKFKGGRLKNGTLVGNDTKIESGKKAIFTGITIEGSWKVSDITSVWFSDINDVNKLSNLIALSSDNIYNNITIDKGDYFFSADKNRYIGLLPKSNTRLTLLGNIYFSNNYYTGYIIRVLRASNVTICGKGKIIGDCYAGMTGAKRQTIGVSVSASKNVIIEGLEIEKCFDGIYTAATVQSEELTIKNNFISNCSRQGITIDAVTNCVIINNTISNVRGQSPQSGIDIEHHKKTNSDKHYIKNVVVKNNNIYDCKGACVSISSSNYDSIKSDSILIEKNTLDGGKCDGIHYGKGVANVQIKGNFIKGTIKVLPKNYSGCCGIVIKDNNICCDNFIWGVRNSVIENNNIICKDIFGCASRYRSVSYNQNTIFKNNVIRTNKIGHLDSKNREVLRFDGDNITFEGNTISSNTAMILNASFCSNIKISHNIFNRTIIGKNQSLIYATNSKVSNNTFNIVGIKREATIFSVFSNVENSILDNNIVNNKTGDIVKVGRFATIVKKQGTMVCIKNTTIQPSIVLKKTASYGQIVDPGYDFYVEPPKQKRLIK